MHPSWHSDSDAFIVNEWPPSLPMRQLGLIALLPGHLSGCTASQGNFNRFALPPWLVSYHWQGSLGFKELLCRMTRQWRKRQDHEDQSTKILEHQYRQNTRRLVSTSYIQCTFNINAPSKKYCLLKCFSENPSTFVAAGATLFKFQMSLNRFGMVRDSQENFSHNKQGSQW